MRVSGLTISFFCGNLQVIACWETVSGIEISEEADRYIRTYHTLNKLAKRKLKLISGSEEPIPTATSRYLKQQKKPADLELVIYLSGSAFWGLSADLLCHYLLLLSRFLALFSNPRD